MATPQKCRGNLHKWEESATSSKDAAPSLSSPRTSAVRLKEFRNWRNLFSAHTQGSGEHGSNSSLFHHTKPNKIHDCAINWRGVIAWRNVLLSFIRFYQRFQTSFFTCISQITLTAYFWLPLPPSTPQCTCHVSSFSKHAPLLYTLILTDGSNFPIFWIKQSCMLSSRSL